MYYTQPDVYLIAQPRINWGALHFYLKKRGALDWYENHVYNVEVPDAEDLVEVAGRMCYRSWEPGLNPNVTKVRTDRADYFETIMKSGHGSVLEHAQYSFILSDVSRVVTHELARHRAGTAISQESLRFVRLEDIPFFMPDWALDDSNEYLIEKLDEHLAQAEELQNMMAGWFDLDNPKTSFHEKKAKTSFMRRFAPEGLTTDLVWSANIRALRHVIDVRTAPGAEEEIRIVFGQVAEIMKEECPLLFADFTNDGGHWTPDYRKV
jgi:thymidylate synthase (FAD)